MSRISTAPNPYYVLTRADLPRMGITARVYIARPPLEDVGTVYTTVLADARRWACHSSARSYKRARPARCAGMYVLNLKRQGHLVTP